MVNEVSVCLVLQFFYSACVAYEGVDHCFEDDVEFSDKEVFFFLLFVFFGHVVGEE